MLSSILSTVAQTHREVQVLQAQLAEQQAQNHAQQLMLEDLTADLGGGSGPLFAQLGGGPLGGRGGPAPPTFTLATRGFASSPDGWTLSVRGGGAPVPGSHLHRDPAGRAAAPCDCGPPQVAARSHPRLPGEALAQQIVSVGGTRMFAVCCPVLSARLTVQDDPEALRRLEEPGALARFLDGAHEGGLLVGARCGIAQLLAAAIRTGDEPADSCCVGVRALLGAAVTGRPPESAAAAAPAPRSQLPLRVGPGGELVTEPGWWFWEGYGGPGGSSLWVPFTPAETRSLDLAFIKGPPPEVPSDEHLTKLSVAEAAELARRVGVGGPPRERVAGLRRYRDALQSWRPPIGRDETLESMPLPALARCAAQHGVSSRWSPGADADTRRRALTGPLRLLRGGPSGRTRVVEFTDTDGDRDRFLLKDGVLWYQPDEKLLRVEDLTYSPSDRRLFAADWTMTFRDSGPALDLLLTQLAQMAHAAGVPCNIAVNVADDIDFSECPRFCGRRIRRVAQSLSWQDVCAAAEPAAFHMLLGRLRQQGDSRALADALSARPLPVVLTQYPAAATLLGEQAEDPEGRLREAWVSGQGETLRPLVEELSRRGAWECAPRCGLALLAQQQPQLGRGLRLLLHSGPAATAVVTVTQQEGRMLRVESGVVQEVVSARFGNDETGWQDVDTRRLRGMPIVQLSSLGEGPAAQLRTMGLLHSAEAHRGGLRVPVDAQLLVRQQAPAPEPWACSQCTFENSPRHERCEMCRSPRVVEPAPGSQGAVRHLEVRYLPRALPVARLLRRPGVWCVRTAGAWVPLAVREGRALHEAYRRGDSVAVLPSSGSFLCGDRSVDLEKMCTADGEEVRHFEGLTFSEAAGRLDLRQTGVLAQRAALAGDDHLAAAPLAAQTLNTAVCSFPLLACGYLASSQDTRRRLQQAWGKQPAVVACLARRGVFSRTVGLGLQWLASSASTPAETAEDAPDTVAMQRGLCLLSAQLAHGLPPTCPQAHTLTPFETRGGFCCDLCTSERNMPPGAKLWGCRKCNYDLCHACYARGARPHEALGCALPQPGYWAIEKQAKWVPVPQADAEKLDHARVRCDFHPHVGAAEGVDFIRMRCRSGRMRRENLAEGQTYEALLMGVSTEVLRLYLEQVRDFTPNDYQLLSRLSEDDVPKCASEEQRARVVPLKAEGGEDPCMICLDDIEEGQQLGRMPCGHAFHSACLSEHFGRSRCCPCCKAEL
eukprot:TRINITY_DN5325_c0_g1_i1.p1 TRINITY_DN5325_c0_g1~~TRINITY_DN5325_c0_g1_i1.p1  ORF type:complete len:1222 (+),score=273.13 TRINITY_DN5325_c0_g1_i1:76-3741(+)